jgi:hypothetical protein
MLEQSFDTLVEALLDTCSQSSSRAEAEQRAYDTLYSKTPGILQAYECPTCGRLAVFRHASDAVPALWLQVEKVYVQQVPSLRALAQQSIEE